ncbi:MAG: LPP20 family lipoprotein [Myxococcota bacterium]
MNRIEVITGLGMAALWLAGCGAQNQMNETTEGQLTPHGPVVEYPKWVNQGSGAFSDDQRVFYGVGSATGIRNDSLARSTADNRARAEISKLFEIYSASLMKDYAGSTTAGDFTASAEEQDVQQAIKTFSANTLNGVEVVDHWIHPTDGTIYSLARLDVEGFLGQIERARELSARVRAQIREQAERTFEDLEQEENKRP